jgi:SAM-dependent methyltransferase
MFKRFTLNAGKPRGKGGSLTLWNTNGGHGALSRWGLESLELKRNSRVLDVGCGGGHNIARMLNLTPEGKVCGLAYSGASVKKSRKLNRRAVAEGRAEIKEGRASEIPWPDGVFDDVTAIETVYGWPDFVGNLREILRVLKPGGTLLICNEAIKQNEGGPPFGGILVEVLNLRMYSPNEYRAALREAGFADAEVRLKGAWGCVVARKHW